MQQIHGASAELNFAQFQTGFPLVLMRRSTTLRGAAWASLHLSLQTARFACSTSGVFCTFSWQHVNSCRGSRFAGH